MKIVILGAGISGLSLAWFLQNRYRDSAEITILEKFASAGGWVRSSQANGFFFEQGPRSCRPFGNGRITLELIEELGLSNQILIPSPFAHRRYLFLDESIYQLPQTPLSALFKPKLWGLFPELIKEIFTKPYQDESEETIRQFFLRHFGNKTADLFVDPFISGIFAGDMDRLSLKSCFPNLYENDRKWGSLIKAALFSKKESRLDPHLSHLKKAKLFSLKGGLTTLIDRLVELFKGEIHLEASIDKLNFEKEKITISFGQQKIEADYLFSSIPSHSLVDLIQPHDSSVASVLSSIPFASLAVVNCGYNHHVLDYQGFGYLVPSSEKEKILGVSWDSQIFPQNNLKACETRLTVMIGGSKMTNFSEYTENDFIEMALEALERHLKIKVRPDAIQCHIVKNAIPQYLVGHQEKVSSIETAIQNLSPRFKVLGNSFYGIAVNDCIAKSKQTALSIALA